MNFKEIIEQLESQMSVSEFAHDDYASPIEGIGICEEIEQVGGCDEGRHWHSVKFFPDHNIYIKVTGWYSSGNGTDFDGWGDCEEVRPKEKTITVYE